MLSFEESMLPVWDADIVYGESLTMVRDKDGVAKAPLLFEPIEVLDVTDAKGSIRYEEGRDFKILNREFILTPDSRIFSFTLDEMFPSEWIKGESFPFPNGNLLFHENSFFHERQISVTYTCSRGQWSGVKPRSVARLLPKTVDRLKNGEPFRLVAYGDSITYGANASRLSNVSPYQDPYVGLFSEGLFRRFGSVVQMINHAVGGKNSEWGIENVDFLVNDYAPDLVLLAFGMNDLKWSAEVFAGNMRTMIDRIRSKYPTCEIILVSTSTPNPLLTDARAPFYGEQCFQKRELDQVAAAYTGIAVADITGMQAFLHSRKRFIDTTGNNVNHPNDFFHRLYAQYLLGMFTANGQ